MNTQTSIRMIVLIALLALALAACTRDASSNTSTPPTSAAAGPAVGTLEFEGSELEFKPSTVQVDQPGRYAVTFTNSGHTEHDWVASGTRLLAKPGETVSGTVEVPAEGLEFICSFPGHAAAGMRGSITVKGAADNQNSSENTRE